MKKLFVFLTGVLAGALIFGAAVSFAATGNKSILAEYSNIKMVVEGKLVQSELEPFLYDGRVYVPLRFAAEAMGKEVGWENNTVMIGSNKQSLLLTDLIAPSESGLECSQGSVMNVSGTPYERGFYITGKDGESGTLSFFVQDKGIKEVSGMLGVDDSNSDSDKVVDATILMGATKVWEGELKKGDQPIPVSFAVDDNINNIYLKFDNVTRTKIDCIDFRARY